MAESLLSKSHIFVGLFRKIDKRHGEPTRKIRGRARGQ